MERGSSRMNQFRPLRISTRVATPIVLLMVWTGTVSAINNVATKVAELPNPDSEIYPLGLDFDVDGGHIAVESFSGKIQIWNWRNKRVEKTLDMPKGFGNGMSTNPISYSPDGLLLSVCDASGADGVVTRIWSTTTWVISKDLIEPTSGICSGLGFTPDGRQFIRTADTGGTRGDNLIAYAVDSWQRVWGLPMPGFMPVSVAISPNGEEAAVAGTIFVAPQGVSDPVQRSVQQRLVANVNIVDLKQRKIVKVIETSAMGPLAWSPDGTRLAIAGGSVEIFDHSSGQKLLEEKIQNSGRMNVRFTPNGRYLIESDVNGSGKGLGVKIWDSQRQKMLQHIAAGDVGSIAVSRAGKYLAVGETGRTTIWQIN
jgi:WD40 repeat protein